MTAGSKLNGYGYESKSGLHFLYMFYGVRLSASHPTPNLEDQGIPFCLGHHLWPIWHVKPYQ